jgi:hypothetical protein
VQGRRVRYNKGGKKVQFRCEPATYSIYFELGGPDSDDAEYRMKKSSTRDVHAFQHKLRVMAEVLHEKKLIERPSIPALAAHAKIKYDTLKAYFKDGRISEANEAKLAAALGFKADNPIWIDPSVPPTRRSHAEGYDYPGRDTLIEFRHMLRLLNDLSANHFVRLQGERPTLLDRNIAVLDFTDSGQQTSSSEALQLFFSLILELGYDASGFSFGFRRVRLRFIFPDESSSALKNRLGAKGEIDIGGAILTVRGGKFESEWYLSVSDAVLQGEYVPTSPLCELANASLGESFSAELSVRLMDGSLRAACGSELPGTAKKIIIERLFAESLADAEDTYGWLTLGRQRLRIVRADHYEVQSNT